MLTPEQEKRLSRFRKDDQVEIVPFDPACLERFEKLKAIIKFTLGEQTKVELRGSSGFGISGKGELDIYIPVPETKFDSTVSEVERFLGSSPKSFYPSDRARFVTITDGKEDEIFVVNDQGKSWLTSLKFEGYLQSHPEELERYRKLKEESAGLSTQGYYRNKEEYINEILNRK